MLFDGKFKIHDRAGFSQKWAADRLTLLDIAIINAGNGLAELIDETTGAFPEFQMIGARPIKGTVFKQLVRTALPGVGFRDANSGAVLGKGTHENRQFECMIFDPRWEADKAVADAAEDGAEAVIAEAGAAIMEASFQHLGQQFYYGIGNDAKGCPGLIAIFDATKRELDATGTTDAQKSSVWGIRRTGDRVQWLLGAGGKFSLSDVRIQDVLDDDGKPFEAYIQGLTSHIGLSVKDIRSVGRIRNLTKEAGKGLSDNLIAQFVAEKFPTGMGPTELWMNKTQREELRKSRITDLVPSPPIPTESQGIPIICTDSIVDGHALEIA